MLRLYDSTTSGNCYKIRLLLAQLGIPYETIAIDVVSRDPRPSALLRGNPLGKVPKLELEGGRVLVESNAILWYLAEGTPHLPIDRESRSDVMRWLFFEQNAHEPNIAVARFILTHLPESEQIPEVIRFLHRRGAAALDAMELQLTDRPFLVRDGYTIADIALYAYTHAADEGGFDLGRYPRIGEWLARVRDQPRHVPLLG
jgi:glutathione S-transferase